VEPVNIVQKKLHPLCLCEDLIALKHVELLGTLESMRQADAENDHSIVKQESLRSNVFSTEANRGFLIGLFINVRSSEHDDFLSEFPLIKTMVEIDPETALKISDPVDHKDCALSISSFAFGRYTTTTSLGVRQISEDASQVVQSYRKIKFHRSPPVVRITL
jgi:hypothetical protein